MVWEIDENDPQQLLIKGLVFTDPDLIQRAIDKGADLDHPKDHHGIKYHPLQLLLSDRPHLYTDNFYANREDDVRRNNKIVNMILQQPLRTDHYDSYDCNYMDRLLRSIRGDAKIFDNIAKALTSTIYDSVMNDGQPYKINYAGIFVGLGEGKDPSCSVRREVMSGIEAVLARVRERLKDPQTEKEKWLNKRFPGVVQQWCEVSPAPDLETLPMPSQAYSDSVRDLASTTSRLVNHMGSLDNATDLEKNMRREITEFFLKAAREVSERVRKEGRLSYLNQTRPTKNDPKV